MEERCALIRITGGSAAKGFGPGSRKYGGIILHHSQILRYVIMRAYIFLLALFLSALLYSEEEEKYVPKDLKDAVRVLTDEIDPADQQKIRTGELENLHFSLGMGLRNGWGLWADSRLSVYFKKNGISHPDNMSGYIIAAFTRSLKEESYDLLEMIREGDKESPRYHYPILTGRIIDRERRLAILFERKDYDEAGYIRSTKLLWNPDDGKIYLKVGDFKKRIAAPQKIKELKDDAEHWNFTKEDIELLEELKRLGKNKRREKIDQMDSNRRKRIDGILPRAQSADEQESYHFDIYANQEASKVRSEEVLLNYTMPSCEFSKTPPLYVIDFMRQKATEALRQRTYRVKHCVTFELDYDPNLTSLETLVNYKVDREISLGKMFTEVLDRVGLSYEVQSDTKIRIFTKNGLQKVADKTTKKSSGEKLMSYVIPKVSISERQYIFVEHYLRLQAKESLNRMPDTADDFVTFNLLYDPGLLFDVNAPINFEGENVTLETLYTDVLKQVGLSYKVVSDTEIDILENKDSKKSSANPFGFNPKTKLIKLRHWIQSYRKARYGGGNLLKYSGFHLTSLLRAKPSRRFRE
ncbi:MAG: hypothetical protein P1V20_30595 [Verrucomicrobiales bacterium]|nr:hypothetical protein [Verrucomicrobiales bacterium]